MALYSAMSRFRELCKRGVLLREFPPLGDWGLINIQLPGNYLQTVYIGVAIGRTITPDDLPGGAALVVISDGPWRRARWRSQRVGPDQQDRDTPLDRRRYAGFVGLIPDPREDVPYRPPLPDGSIPPGIHVDESSPALRPVCHRIKRAPKPRRCFAPSSRPIRRKGRRNRGCCSATSHKSPISSGSVNEPPRRCSCCYRPSRSCSSSSARTWAACFLREARRDGGKSRRGSPSAQGAAGLSVNC